MARRQLYALPTVDENHNHNGHHNGNGCCDSGELVHANGEDYPA